MSVESAVENNTLQVAYTSAYNTDKIVHISSGSFKVGTDTIIRTYTLAGAGNNVVVYRFAHGFTRPLFMDLQWSVDDSAYFEGGGTPDASNHACLAYADATYIYIQCSSAFSFGDTVYYRLVGTWIDDYDTTNPNITPPTTNAEFQLFSDYVTSRIVTDGVLEVSSGSATLTSVVTTVSHGLSYAPEVKVYIESFSGEVWPLNFGGTTNVHFVDDNQMEGRVFGTTSNLAFITDMKSAMGTRKVWYRVYGKRGGYVDATVTQALNV